MNTAAARNGARQQPEVLVLSPAARLARRRERQQVLMTIIGRLLLLVFVIIVWQFLSGRFVNPLFISSPQAVVARLIEWSSDGTPWYDGTLLSNTAVTVEETLLCLFFGAVIGILAGIMLGVLPVVARILDPFIVSLYSIPKVALAPLFILWFGIELQMKVVLAAVTVFFLVFINTLTGVREVDQNLVNAVTLMGGRRRDILLKVMLPAATGYILTGLRIAIPYSLIGAVIGELVASNSGLGYLINSSASEFDTAGVFAALLVLTIIAGLLNAAVNLIDRKASRWKAGMVLSKKMPG